MGQRTDLRAAPLPPVEILAQGADLAHTGDLLQTALASVTIPGGTMGPRDQIEVTAAWSWPNSANNKTPRTRFAGNVVQASNYTTTLTAQLYVRIANKNALDAQVAHASGSTGFGSSTGAPLTLAVDTSVDQVLDLTGQLGSAGETIRLESYTVKLLRAPE